MVVHRPRKYQMATGAMSILLQKVLEKKREAQTLLTILQRTVSVSIKMDFYAEKSRLMNQFKWLFLNATQEQYTTISTVDFSDTFRKKKNSWRPQKSILWIYTDFEVHLVVFKCESCRRHRPSQKHQQELQFFSPTEPLKSVAIDILGPLIKTRIENWLIIVMTDRKSKLTQAVPAPKIAAPYAAVEVLGNWIVPYLTPRTVISHNCLQFVSKNFAALFAATKTILSTTRVYHSHCNGQLKRLKKRLVACLRLYIHEYYTKQNSYMQQLAYGYSTRLLRATNTSQFSMVLGREPFAALIKEKSENKEKHNTEFSAQAHLKELETLRLPKQEIEWASQKVRKLYEQTSTRGWAICQDSELGTASV